MTGKSGLSVYHAIKIQFDRYGKNARLSHGVRKCDRKRNVVIAKELEKVMPERCFGLVDKNGTIFRYCMMTLAEAREKSKSTSLLGFRWTQCTPKNMREVKTK